MTLHDSEYKKLNNRIGAAMMFFLLFFNVFSVIYTIIGEIDGGKSLYIFNEIMWGAMYMASFMLPVLVFYSNLKRKKEPKPQMLLEIRLSKRLPLYILAGLGLNFVASYINSIIVAPFGVYEYMESIMPAVEGEYYLYDLVLETIGTAIVPAFCEEFLFRGLILASLLPYGKKPAIIGSALLFALMHQNPAQIVYTFVAGLILGYIAAESESIWGGIILHFINNFVSVIQSALYRILPEAGADLVSSIIILAVIAVGAVATVVLVVMYVKRTRRVTQQESEPENSGAPSINDGVFGISLPLNLPLKIDEREEKTLSRGYAVKGFFAPLTIAFTVIALLENLFILLISMAYTAI